MGRIILISIFLICSSILHAQDLRFKHYSDDDGLSHNSIRSIVQDSKGYIWLGTFGGLNRFNGFEFNTFTGDISNTDYLQDNDITQLVLEDEVLWIGTSNGLTRYHIPTSKFKTFHPDSTNTDNIGNLIRSLCIDKSGRILVGTKFHGICYFNKEKEEFIPIPIKGVEYVRSISQTSDGVIWVGTFKEGVYSFQWGEDDQILNLKHYNLTSHVDNEIFNPDVFFIFEDHKSDVFIGTRNGLFKKGSDDNFTLLRYPHSIPDFFRCIARDQDGNYWLGTLNGLITCEKLEDIATNKYLRHINDFTMPVSLTNNYVTSLFFDKSGVLWIGTENGLDKYDPFENQFKMVRGNSLVKDLSLKISSYGKTYDNQLLVGTHANGLYLLKNSKLKQITPSNIRVASIYTADGKEFYCGLWDGRILHYNYLTSEKKINDVGIKDSPVFPFFKLSASKLLIGSHNNSVIEYDLKQGKSQRFKPDEANLYSVTKIVKDESGVLWFATPNGIFSYNSDSDHLKNYNNIKGSTKGLSNSIVKDMMIDTEGKLWVGTRKGLNFYNPGIDDFEHITEPNEIKDIWITDLATDSIGNIWMNINYNKVAKFNPVNKNLNFFLVKSGMRSTIYDTRGFLYFDHSRVYLGGEDGMIYFSPVGISENTYTPKPVVDRLMVHNTVVLSGEEIHGQVILNKDFNYAKRMELNYQNRDFSISFSSPSYINEKLNLYQYILQGYDKDWIVVGSNQRNVQYTNLKPGKYKFKIKARNNNGYWSSESIYNIEILPPFWYTYKAFTIYIILFLLLFYQIRRIIVFRVKMKQELLLEKVRREKDEKLNEEKLRFFTNISHELKTPLTLILGPIQQLKEYHTGDAKVTGKYNLIHSNASRLLELVDQIIDFRKAEQGKISLKVSHVDIVRYSLELFDSFQLMADQKQLSYTFNCEQKEIIGWMDKNKYERIFFNLLSNAFKFTSQGEVRVELKLEGTKIKFSVIDTGSGIPLEKQEKIFDRFYQGENQLKYNTGSGIGLALVKSLVEIHRGKIWLESTLDKGSSFHVELPVNRDSYQANEIFDHKLDHLSMETSTYEPVENDIQPIDEKGSVLVIEDNEELRKYVADILSGEYRVHEACDGLEGLEVAKKTKPTIIVSDVMMERMDGFEFCRQLKNDDEISHIPVILLTALSEVEKQKEGFKMGADAYISKPFDPSLLKIRITNILENRKRLKERYSSEPDIAIEQLLHSKADDDFMKQIHSCIEEHIANPKLNKEMLCAELGYSSSKLYRKVKALTNLSPNELIRTSRLKRACVLLKNIDNNVSDVAYEVGFSDPFYFSRCFSKQFGYPPSKIQEQIK